jgi:hypothetical protein
VKWLRYSMRTLAEEKNADKKLSVVSKQVNSLAKQEN